MDLVQSLKNEMEGAIYDGTEMGMQMAIDALSEALPHVATENQTWASAIASLSLLKARMVAERPERAK